FFSQLEERLEQLPGVESAALVTELPMGGYHIPHNFVVVGRPPLAVGTEPDAGTNLASPAYFSTLHIPLPQGPFFTAADRAGAPLVAIVNEAMVRQYFANENPIDQQIYFARDPTHTRFTIIGVVGDVKESGPHLDAEPTIYTALLQKHE